MSLSARTRLGPYEIVAVVGAGGMGELLFPRNSMLFAQPFDADRLAITGEATPIVEGVGNSGALGVFSTTASALVYRSGPGGGQQARLTWLDRQGKPQSQIGSPAAYFSMELAPDASRVAVEYTNVSNPDVWVIELARGVASRFTMHQAVDRLHVWSPDGSRIVFQSNRTGVFDLYVKPAHGSGDEELLRGSPFPKSPTSWSSDGRFLLYTEDNQETGNDIWLLTLSDRNPVVLLRTPSSANLQRAFHIRCSPCLAAAGRGTYLETARSFWCRS